MIEGYTTNVSLRQGDFMALNKWVLKLPWDILSITAEKHGLEPELVAAVSYHESGGNKYAMRYEPNWSYFYQPDKFAHALSISVDSEMQSQKFSYGYLQVMGSVARELGYTDSLIRLCEPFNAYEYGCAKLAECFRRFPIMNAAIAAYNAGTPKMAANGVGYINQQYVDSVLGYYANLVH